jgi:hypothetical protein
VLTGFNSHHMGISEIGASYPDDSFGQGEGGRKEGREGGREEGKGVCCVVLFWWCDACMLTNVMC